MVLNSITRPVTNLATGLFNNGVAAVKFCNRTISVGYTNYLAPTVSLVAKGAFSVISNKTAQAGLLLGAAAYFAKKGYEVYKAASVVSTNLKEKEADLAAAGEGLVQARSKFASAEDTQAAQAEINVAEAKVEIARQALDAARNPSKATVKALAPYVAGVVASVAVAAFAVIR